MQPTHARNSAAQGSSWRRSNLRCAAIRSPSEAVSLRSGLRSSETSPQTFRIKVIGRGGQWKIAGERYSILVNLASLVLPVYLSISDEKHFCFNQSARGAGCVSAMWIDSPARSRRLSEVYALLGIAACGDTSETLNDLLSEIDVQDAECRAKAGIA